MKHGWSAIVGVGLLTTVAFPALVSPKDDTGPYARIAILRPNDGDTVDFEAGDESHLEWHRQARDAWVWYGWTVTFGDRQRWFMYASFGHSAESFENGRGVPGGGRARQH